jgi:hypothetical protein
VLENVREMELFQLFGDEQNPSLVKAHTPYSLKKIFLFSRITDMHVITDISDMHSTPWSAQYMKIYRDCLTSETPVMHLSLG